jgi:hypothetical protein
MNPAAIDADCFDRYPVSFYNSGDGKTNKNERNNGLVDWWIGGVME